MTTWTKRSSPLSTSWAERSAPPSTTFLERSEAPSTSWSERANPEDTSWTERSNPDSTTFLEGPFFAQQQSPFYMFVRGVQSGRYEPSKGSDNFYTFEAFPGTHFMGRDSDNFMKIAEK